jgi:CRISPR-associated protein Cas2
MRSKRDGRDRRGNRSQITCYVVAYDIPDDRRRSRVHQILTGFGKGTPYSFFECFLTRRDLILLQSKLSEYLLSAEDSVRFYPLCANCVARVETIGDPAPKDEMLFIVSAQPREAQ